jgi:hypothetical protein
MSPFLLALLCSCNEAKFAAGDDAHVEPTPSLSPNATPPPQQCKDVKTVNGADLVFLLDNSGSNAETDCPSRQNQGGGRFQCNGATERERAVLSAFDQLVKVEAKYKISNAAESRIAVASFPTRNSSVSGWEIHGEQQAGGWYRTEANVRSDLSDLLAFTRRPYGHTPFGAGIEAAEYLFTRLPAASNNAPRSKLAILVTDGEPTDRDPVAVIDAATHLRGLTGEKSIQLITVFVTGGTLRESRLAEHRAMLEGYDRFVSGDGSAHWWVENQTVKNFQDYIDVLLGSPLTPGLTKRISSKIIEVKDAAALSKVFQGIIQETTEPCK